MTRSLLAECFGEMARLVVGRCAEELDITVINESKRNARAGVGMAVEHCMKRIGAPRFEGILVTSK
jgi:hypothetical protein